MFVLLTILSYTKKEVVDSLVSVVTVKIHESLVPRLLIDRDWMVVWIKCNSCYTRNSNGICPICGGAIYLFVVKFIVVEPKSHGAWIDKVV